MAPSHRNVVAPGHLPPHIGAGGHPQIVTVEGMVRSPSAPFRQTIVFGQQSTHRSHKRHGIGHGAHVGHGNVPALTRPRSQRRLQCSVPV